MFTTETLQAIDRVAAQFGLEAAALKAVAEIESGGRAFTQFGARREPLIRFEGHYFDRRLTGTARAEARRQGLSSPVAGAIANPAAQAARWALLDRAAAIDARAAYESVSWGLGQVMGAHWAWLGYGTVEALMREARADAEGQARLMARYIAKAGLADALARQNWAAFARGYNGPGYRANAYDTSLAAAYARHRRSAPTAPHPGTTLLRRGSRGAAVADLQRLLTAAGYPLEADGDFGAATEVALRDFQRTAALEVDGIAGPKTIAALNAAQPFSGWLRRLWNWFR